MSFQRTARHLIHPLSLLAAGALLAGLAGCGGDVVVFEGSGTTGGQGGATTSTGTSTSVTVSVGGGDVGGFGGQGGTGGDEPPPPELCTDGVDNDGNGLVDCEDPACGAGFTCVDDAPAGWQGPLFVHQSPFGAPTQPCANGDMPESYYAGPAGAAECTACACGDLDGAACGAPKFECWSGSQACGGNSKDWTGALSDGNCHKPQNLLGFTNTLSCAVTAPGVPTAAGSCPVSGGELTNPDPMKTAIDACGTGGLKGGGCGAGKVCVPKGVGDPAESVCVRMDGQASCPAGWLNAGDVFASYKDERACEACSCAANATCQGGSYTFFDQNNCAPPGQGASQPIVIDSADCKNVSALLDSGSWSVDATLPTVGGSCTPVGGGAAGTVTPEQPVTFCCK